MLNLNCIRCAFGPGSVASRGLFFEAETASRNWRSEWDAVSLWARFGNRVPEFDSRVGHTFPLSLFGKLCPRIRLQSGAGFPVGPQAENTSRNQASKWDALSLWVRFGKLRPGIKLQSGMRFPKWPPSGNCVPEFELGVGCAFPLGALWETASQFERLFRDAVSAEGFIWKVRPVLSAQTGTRFPL